MYRICIICPQQLIREALKEVVQKSPAEVVAEGRDSDDVLERYGKDVKPDLVVLDLDLGKSLSADLAQISTAYRCYSGAKVLVLTDAATFSTCMQALRAGAQALLSRDITSDVLLKAVHLTMSGQILLPSPLMKLIMEHAHALEHGPIAVPSPQSDPLPPRARGEHMDAAGLPDDTPGTAAERRGSPLGFAAPAQNTGADRALELPRTPPQSTPPVGAAAPRMTAR